MPSDDIDPQETHHSSLDDFLEGKVTKGAAGLIGAALIGQQLAKYGKRGFARAIDTHGFGANVEGSYSGESKISQFTNNLLQAGKGTRRRMPLTLLKSLIRSGNPLELEAVKSSLTLLNKHMSMLKSQGLHIPKKMKEYYLNLQTMAPERKMAQAVLQKSFNQPINFKHGGTFIQGANVRMDPDINKALQNKGFNTKKPFTVYDVSHKDPTNKATKHMTQKLRAAATGDPRLQLITKELKKNNISKALEYAKDGTIKYKGNLIKTGSPIQLVAEGSGLTAKFSPAYMARGGKLKSVKEYVIGGHTQRVHYKPFEGFTGLRKSHADVFDITSYASQGEKGKNVITKARILAAGEKGRQLGIHQPVVTVSSYSHNKPGSGRAPGATDVIKRKARKFVSAAAKTYSSKVPKNAKRKTAEYLLRATKALLTKGRSF
jgi:biotin operon repressor